MKTGLVDLAQGRFLSQLQTMREKGDYNCIYDVTEDDIIPMIEPAKLLIITVEQLIDSHTKIYECNNEPDENKLNEPLAAYQSLSVGQDIPKYILEDIQISLDEYKRGEYRLVEDFMKKYL